MNAKNGKKWRDPATWLLDAARRLPFMKFAIAVVACTAGAALSLYFFFGNAIAPAVGGVGVIAAMVVIRLLARAVPAPAPINFNTEIRVLVWASVVAYVAVLGLGVAALGMAMFPERPLASSALAQAADQVHEDTIDAQLAARDAVRIADEAARNPTPENLERSRKAAKEAEEAIRRARSSAKRVRALTPQEKQMLDDASETLKRLEHELEGHALLSKGIKLYERGDYTAAVDEFRKVIEGGYDTSLVKAREMRGWAYMSLGDLARADDDFSTWTTIDAKNPSAFTALGRLTYSEKKWTESIAAFQKAVALKQDLFDAWHGLGDALAERDDIPTGDLEQAIAAYSTAINLKPDSAWSWTNRGWCHARLGWRFAKAGNQNAERNEFAAARRDLDEAIRLEASFSEKLQLVMSLRFRAEVYRYSAEEYSEPDLIPAAFADIDRAIGVVQSAVPPLKGELAECFTVRARLDNIKGDAGQQRLDEQHATEYRQQ